MKSFSGKHRLSKIAIKKKGKKTTSTLFVQSIKSQEYQNMLLVNTEGVYVSVRKY